MNSLKPPDSLHLRAAEGWFELGDPLEANEELERISPSQRAHPDILELRLQIYARSKKWEECVDLGNALVKTVPERAFGWIHRSFALHELKRTQEAFDLLFPVANRFKKNWTAPYNLSCYCAQLGRLEECEEWFKKAMAIDAHVVKAAGIDDPDLKPLWDSMDGTVWKKLE